MTSVSARLVFAALLLSAGASASAQSNLLRGADPSGPLAAVGRLRSLGSVAGENSLLSGELAEAQIAAGALGPPDKALMLEEGRAVVRLPASGSEPDIYLHLRQESERWTIHALRALALPRFVVELRDRLRALPARTAELDQRLHNLELTLSSDAELRAWFAAHQAALERLRSLAYAGGGSGRTMADGSRTIETPEAAQALRELHALGLTVSPGGTVTVTIGGILDNSVGFLHSADPDAVPAIDPSDHIWVEALGDGWYLFKTT